MNKTSIIAPLVALLASTTAFAQTLTFPSSLHTGCLPNTATLTLTAAAPAGGTTFTLSSSNPALLTAPASVTVAEGLTSASIPVTTGHVDSNTVVTLTATGPSTVARNLTLRANAPVAMSAPNSMGPGQVSSGTFTLACTAPAGGQVVTMTSNSALMTVPATVTVAEGAVQGTFGLTAGDFTTASTVSVTAARGGVSRSRSITLKLPTPKTLSFNSSLPIGGTTSTGTVTLDVPAGASGVVVDIASQNTAVAAPAVSQVTVTSGQTTATFLVNTVVVNASTDVIFTAVGNGVTKQATLTVRPNRIENIRASQFAISTCRGVDAELQLLVPAGTAGATVPLTVDRNDIITLTPTELVFAEGEEAKPFTATTTAAPTTPQAGVITGTFNISKILKVNVVRTSPVGCP